MHEHALATQDDLERAAAAGRASLYPSRLKILIGSASCGIAAGARAKSKRPCSAPSRTSSSTPRWRTGCIGFCQREPLVDLMLPGGPRISYANMTAKRIRELLESYAGENDVKPKWALCRFAHEDHVAVGQRHEYPPPNGFGVVPQWTELDFFRRQERVILRNCGSIDPLNLDEAIARGAYRGAWKALTAQKPDEVIDAVLRSGLRGRGGAGFPTGQKWETGRSSADVKYVICNADEGDPGAFMDRSVLEGDPHAVLEGMLIASFAIGDARGWSTCAASIRWRSRPWPTPSPRRNNAGFWATTSSAPATRSA